MSSLPTSRERVTALTLLTIARAIFVKLIGLGRLHSGVCRMSCRVCASENQSGFPAEIAIHLPGVTTPHVFLFPQVVVCMDCGFTEFSIPETELPRVAKQNSPAA
jgi:hypothetical protein